MAAFSSRLLHSFHFSFLVFFQIFFVELRIKKKKEKQASLLVG